MLGPSFLRTPPAGPCFTSGKPPLKPVSISALSAAGWLLKWNVPLPLGNETVGCFVQSICVATGTAGCPPAAPAVRQEARLLLPVPLRAAQPVRLEQARLCCVVSVGVRVDGTKGVVTVLEEVEDVTGSAGGSQASRPEAVLEAAS